MSGNRSRLIVWFSPLLALLLAGLYWPAIQGEFLFDDVVLLVAHDCWRGFDQLTSTLDSTACSYRPFRYATFALDYELFGLDSTWMHVTNLSYHMIVASMVFLILRRYSTAWVAAMLVLVWAVHPVHMDSVAYISGRRDVVSTLFFLLAFLQLSDAPNKRWRPRHLVLGLFFFVLGLLTKEMAVTLPAVVVWALIVGFWHKSASIKRHLARYWPGYALAIAIAAAFIVYRGVLDNRSALGGQWWGGTPATNFATALALYPRYFGLMVWPDPLIGDYFPTTIALASGFSDPWSLLGLGLIVSLLVVIAVAVKKGWTATAVGLGWFLITMLPISHIFPHHEIFAEHYLYLPSIGLFLALTPALQRLLSSTRRIRTLAVIAIGLIVVALSARVAKRAPEWSSELQFYQAAYQHAPGNARVLYTLAVNYAEIGECEQALPILEAAIPILNPSSTMGQESCRAFLVCSEQIDSDRGVEQAWQTLLEGNPDHPLGLAWRGRDHLGNGRFEAAIVDLSRSAALTDGSRRGVLRLLVFAYDQIGEPTMVLDVLRTYQPDGQFFCEQEVEALARTGSAEQAQLLRRVSQCLDRFPYSLELIGWRATLNFLRGEPMTAIEDIERLFELHAPAELLERIRARVGTAWTE